MSVTRSIEQEVLDSLAAVESELRDFRSVLMRLQVAMIDSIGEHDKRLSEIVNAMAQVKGRKR
jgi:hypothetical protein